MTHKKKQKKPTPTSKPQKRSATKPTAPKKPQKPTRKKPGKHSPGSAATRRTAAAAPSSVHKPSRRSARAAGTTSQLNWNERKRLFKEAADIARNGGVESALDHIASNDPHLAKFIKTEAMPWNRGMAERAEAHLREKLAKTQAQLNEARKLANEYETRYNKLLKSTRGMEPQKEQYNMNDKQKKSLQTLAAAAAAALMAFSEDAEGEAPKPVETPAAAPAPARKKDKPAPAAAAPAAAAAAAAAPAAAAPAAAPAGNGAPDLMTQARHAAKDYAGTFGREGLKEVLSKFTEGTVADVPADKLPEFIAALKG